MSSNFSRYGIIYCVIYSFGKPPLMTLDELHKLTGFGGNWNIEIYSSEKGRTIGIRSLQRIGTKLIFTCELRLGELIDKSKSASLYPSDRAKKGNMVSL